MLSRPEIWVSRAESANDATEVRYALELARDVLRRSSTSEAESKFSERVLACLDGRAEKVDWNVVIEPFVASFCTGIDSALHWLHYGRSGTGCAIGFESASLVSSRFVLRRVIYDRQRQEGLLGAAIGLFKDVLPSVTTSRELEATAVACAASLRTVAARIKSPHFQAEDEWRLMTLLMRGRFVRPSGDGAPEPSVRFRAVGERIVPFVTAPFDPQCVQQIALGYSVRDTEDAIRFAATLAGWSKARVLRSNVPVR